MKPDDLISFPFRGGQRFFFMGPSLKKPHVQVLLEGVVFGASAQIGIYKPH